jgi:erythronate-4-phosphate dehydrogenase
VFPSNYNITEFVGRSLNSEILKETQCHTLFIRSTVKANAELLKDTKVEFVATATSGYDHVDTDYLFRNSIFFSGALGSNANSVAEYVVFSILKWALLKDFDLKEKTIGIVGFGSVGKLVAKYSAMLGMKILVNDPPLFEAGFQFPDNCRHCSLDELIANSDAMTNHVPLNPWGDHPTVGLMDENLANFRSEGLFIHASRGGVCSENAIMNLIKDKNVAVAIDVWRREPQFNAELASRAMIATPHVAGHSLDGKLRGSGMMAEAYQKFYREKLDTESIDSLLREYSPLPIECYSDYADLYKKLTVSRAIDSDTQAMLKFLALPAEDRAKAFEQFRTGYPVRREIL